MKSEIDMLIEKTLSDFSESRNDIHMSNENTTTLDAQRLKNAVITEVKDNVLPKHYAYACLILFIITNAAVGALLCSAFYYDIKFIESGKTLERLITPQVMMALIAGITVQTGTAFLLITKYFFKAEKTLKSEITSIKEDTTTTSTKKP